MIKFFSFLLLLLNLTADAQLNMQLRSNLPYGAQTSNIGGFVDHSGNEYALVGWWYGFSVVDVTDPDSPVVRFDIPGNASTWREVKTYRDYAYVTTEACCDGLQIIDLSQLPASINTITYTGDSLIANNLQTIHALHIDTARAFLYLFGSNIDSGSAFGGYPVILDISDPLQPHYAGKFILPAGIDYVHDGYVENDTAYYCHIYEGIVSVVDETDKANPVLLATIQTPSLFPHNAWLSADHQTLFTTDEVPDSYLAAFDISDLSNISELSRFQTAPGTGAIIHNTHIHNEYAVTSWYTEGVVITDVSRPQNPVEVGHYDTYPQGSGPGINGDWGVYPYLPSGNIVASDINNGLFVLTPNYLRGCYLEGIVTDSLTGIPLSNATARIISLSISSLTNITGNYYAGTVIPGTYDVEFSKPGYYSRIIPNVNLSNGNLTLMDVRLLSEPLFPFSGNIVDSVTGIGIPGAAVSVANNNFAYNATCNASGQFLIPAMYSGNYNVIAGKWGYITNCLTTLAIDSVSSFPTIQLAPGYYDDFIFDFGWTHSGSSTNIWERGEPVGTFDVTQTINPEYDSPLDCGDPAFVTDNGGGDPDDHDVDNGTAVLTSPVFDATIYLTPVVDYYRWFINRSTTGTANDTIVVKLTNGTDTTILETRHSGSSGAGIWMHRTFDIASRILPTPNMQLILEVTDYAPDHTCEAGLDKFQITGLITIGINENRRLLDGNIRSLGNPFSNSTTINYETSAPITGSQLMLCVIDAPGKIVEKVTLAGSAGFVEIGNNLSPGIYFVMLMNDQRPIAMLKICKMN